MFKNRYEELLTLIYQNKPRRILEVGTWNGVRAMQMCSWGAEYVGFDLFETASDVTDYDEKNVKKHHTAADVSKFLTASGVKHTLIKGNTRETLPMFFGSQVDFAFIDGGHSIETIASDWHYVSHIVRPGGVVVFDDYYEEIATDKWGANFIVDALGGAVLSQSADPIVGGGKTRIAWVTV